MPLQSLGINMREGLHEQVAKTSLHLNIVLIMMRFIATPQSLCD